MKSVPVYITFGINETLSSPELYYSRVPTVELYRYSDNTMVKSLIAEDSFVDSEAAGVKTGIYSDFDQAAMYFKFIAPSVRLNLTKIERLYYRLYRL